MKRRINRRTFLSNTALGGLGLLVLKDSRAAFSYEANEKLNIALIGVGGRGSWFVGAIPRVGGNVVAMCDVNERKAGGSFKEIPKAKKYHDFRKMLSEMDKQIDAVVMCEIEDNDPKRVPTGRLALQVHQGPPMLVQVKDIRLRQF